MSRGVPFPPRLKTNQSKNNGHHTHCTPTGTLYFPGSPFRGICTRHSEPGKKLWDPRYFVLFRNKPQKAQSELTALCHKGVALSLSALPLHASFCPCLVYPSVLHTQSHTEKREGVIPWVQQRRSVKSVDCIAETVVRCHVSKDSHTQHCKRLRQGERGGGVKAPKTAPETQAHKTLTRYKSEKQHKVPPLPPRKKAPRKTAFQLLPLAVPTQDTQAMQRTKKTHTENYQEDSRKLFFGGIYTPHITARKKIWDFRGIFFSNPPKVSHREGSREGWRDRNGVTHACH